MREIKRVYYKNNYKGKNYTALKDYMDFKESGGTTSNLAIIQKGYEN